MVSKNENVVYIRVDQETHRALKHVAIDEGRTVSDIIRELINQYLKRERVSDRSTYQKKTRQEG